MRGSPMPRWPSLLLGLLAALAVLLLGGALGLSIQGRLRSRAAGVRARRGLQGERRAERLLERAGYTVVDRQVAGGYIAELDGAPQEVSLSADLLVERSGRRWVAEVKTGSQAPRFEYADTRRQLLEYQLAFGGDAVLLVDVDRGLIKEVRFPVGGHGGSERSLGWHLAILGTAALALAILARYGIF